MEFSLAEHYGLWACEKLGQVGWPHRISLVVNAGDDWPLTYPPSPRLSCYRKLQPQATQKGTLTLCTEVPERRGPVRGASDHVWCRAWVLLLLLVSGIGRGSRGILRRPHSKTAREAGPGAESTSPTICPAPENRQHHGWGWSGRCTGAAGSEKPPSPMLSTAGDWSPF